jgi:glycosyltransferase involved in cell wall biosynthesis
MNTKTRREAGAMDSPMQASDDCAALTASAAIRLSIALVTRNRPESLERCLKSLRAQSIQPFEIIVSDDSNDEFVAANKALCLQYDCIYKAGPRRGLYANRNNAALNCAGTHILTADDDHSHPQDYLKEIVSLATQERDRIWIFGERSCNLTPSTPLICPPELDRSGHGGTPADPSNCAAIADGSTVYPRRIFDSGLRYDETYSFGSIWYLWGQVLVKHGWRISFSPATFIYHHEDMAARKQDASALQRQLECMTYVLFVNALWINRSLSNLLWATAYLLRRMIWPDSIVWFEVKTRLDFDAALRIIHRAVTYPGRVKQLTDSHRPIEL